MSEHPEWIYNACDEILRHNVCDECIIKTNCGVTVRYSCINEVADIIAKHIPEDAE